MTNESTSCSCRKSVVMICPNTRFLKAVNNEFSVKVSPNSKTGKKNCTEIDFNDANGNSVMMRMADWTVNLLSS